MCEPTNRPVDRPDTTQPPTLDSSPDPDPGVSEEPKGAYGAQGEVEGEPAESRRP